MKQAVRKRNGTVKRLGMMQGKMELDADRTVSITGNI